MPGNMTIFEKYIRNKIKTRKILKEYAEWVLKQSSFSHCHNGAKEILEALDRKYHL